jgi:CheY-like chemotaxis protein
VDEKMSKKLLVVDDQKKYRERYSALAQELGIEVILAEGVKDGIEKALAEMPDAIVTDKDMPDGTGNDLAKAVRDAYDVPIAGITGGNPEQFDKETMRYRLSKSIPDTGYQRMLIQLLGLEEQHVKAEVEQGRLEKGFYDKFQEIRSTVVPIQDSEFAGALAEVYETLIAIDILVQGVILTDDMRNRREHVQEMMQHLKVPEDGAEQKMLDIKGIGVEPEKIGEYRGKIAGLVDCASRKASGESAEGGIADAMVRLRDDRTVNGFLDKLEQYRIEDITIDECRAYHDAIIGLDKAYQGAR